MIWKRKSDGGRIAGKLLRSSLSVWLTLWILHLPVPVIHQHVGEHSNGRRPSPLSLHLGRYHRTSSSRESFPWHIHWAQLSDLADSEFPDGESDDPQDAKTIAVVQAPVTSLVLASFADLPVTECESAGTALCGSSTELPHIGLLLPRHFLQTYSAALPVRALIGAARC